MRRSLFMALMASLGIGCDGDLFGNEKVDRSWCTTTWMCNPYSGAVAISTDGECAGGLVPAICLYYGDTDASDEDVYCHEPALFEDSCLYESQCTWDEDAGYYIVECTDSTSGMP